MTLENMIDFWKDASPKNILVCLGLTSSQIPFSQVVGVQLTKKYGYGCPWLILDVELKSYQHVVKRFVMKAGQWYEEEVS